MSEIKYKIITETLSDGRILNSTTAEVNGTQTFISGTVTDTREKATVKALQQLGWTPPMPWTTEPPTEPGWYWVKDKYSTRVAEIALEYGLLNVYVTGVETDCSLSTFTHFAGPIPEPKE